MLSFELLICAEVQSRNLEHKCDTDFDTGRQELLVWIMRNSSHEMLRADMVETQASRSVSSRPALSRTSSKWRKARSGIVVHAFNLSIQESEPFRSLNSSSSYRASSRIAKFSQEIAETSRPGRF